VKLLVDMNLSPSWIERLARHGFEAVHWSTIGAATAPDYEILTWANEHGFVLVTNDLDFSSILAASAEATPRSPWLKGDRHDRSAVLHSRHGHGSSQGPSADTGIVDCRQ
jgi:predicted nuclease of predicted toxin-antitoxin system